MRKGMGHNLNSVDIIVSFQKTVYQEGVKETWMLCDMCSDYSGSHWSSVYKWNV